MATPRRVRNHRWLARRLVSAAKRNNVQELCRLLQRGANPNAVRYRSLREWTALMLASMRGHAEAVSVLLQAGAEVNAFHPYEKRTALMLAARHGHLEVARLLIRAGAWVSVDLSYSHWHHWNHTPLTLAVLYGHVRMAHLLLDHGARPTMPTGSFAPPVEPMVRARVECIQHAHRPWERPQLHADPDRVSRNEERLWLELLERIR